MELVGPSKRVWAGMVSAFFFPAGIMALAGIAYALKDWQYIQIAISAPTVLLLTFWWQV